MSRASSSTSWLPRSNDLKIPAIACLISLALLLAGCGFNFPNQTKLQESIPEIDLQGDYHDRFYKMVKRNLIVSGVKVYDNGVGLSDEKRDTIPKLMLPKPRSKEYVASVDSMAQAIEYNIIVSVSANLVIAGHRPISIKNSLTRSTLNKAGHSLATTTEKQTVINETLEELADEMVLRIGYLGRRSDPDAEAPTPVSLLDTEEEHFEARQDPSVTLIEALQQADQAERAQAESVTLDELNNGQRVLGDPQLPKVRPELMNEIPQGLAY